MVARQTLYTFVKYINTFDRRYLISLALCLELLIAWGDYITGPLAPFAHFYLIPITCSAYFLGKRWTFIITLLAIIAGIPVFLQPLKSGQLMPLMLDLTSKTIIYLFFVLLVSEMRKLMDTLKELASEDPLTRANSGRYFYEFGSTEIARAQRSKQPLTLAFIDLDNFKDVNDTLGHQQGDALLVEIAATIKANLREGDILGRLGGDEFAILLTQTDQQQAKVILSRMQANLLNAVHPYDTRVTFSIGVVTYLADKPTSMKELVALADKAMYVIKKSTKNAIQYCDT